MRLCVLCFSSTVWTRQYERYPVQTHPLWSWLNDPWPEDVHAGEGEALGREGSRGEEQEENKRRRRNKMDKICSKIKRDDRCKCVPSDTSVSYVLTESWPNLTTVVQESCRSFSSYRFPCSCCFHLLFHFFHQAHRSRLIKDRTRQDNGGRWRSWEKDGEPSSKMRWG